MGTINTFVEFSPISQLNISCSKVAIAATLPFNVKKQITYEDISGNKYIDVVRKKVKYFYEIKDMISCNTIRAYKQDIQRSSVRGKFVFSQRKQIILKRLEYDYINLIIDEDFKNKNILVPIAFILDPEKKNPNIGTSLTILPALFMLQ